MKNVKCGVCLGLAVMVIAVLTAATIGTFDNNPLGTTIAGGVYYDFNPWLH